MKRTFISVMLFGALLTASTSMFVSCAKDYDGDITELRDKITTNATDLSSLVDEKVKNVQAEIDALTTQQSALDAAYKAADKALEEAIKNATNDANGYADIQAAEAQKAAIAAAQEMVNTAVANMQSALDAANSKIAEQGKTVEGLLAADKELSVAIVDAKNRADNAYTLAEQANALAGENKSAIESLTKSLQTASESLGKLETSLATLEGQLKDVVATATANKASLDVLKTELSELKSSNEAALKSLSDKDDELKKLIDDNNKSITEALSKEESARKSADEQLQKSIDAVKDLYTQLSGKVETIDTNVKTLQATAQSLSSDVADLKTKVAELTKKINALEQSTTSINSKLTALFQSLDNLITGIIMQDASQLEILSAQVKSSATSINQTGISTLTMLDKNTVYFPYKGADGAKTLETGKYNVEKNGGLIYFTLNPNTVDFNGKVNSLKLENSKQNAPANISVGTVEKATNHLVTTRAANGFYQARVSFTGGQQSSNPTFENSFALYSTYKSVDSLGAQKEHRVYSKYEVNLETTAAASDVTPVLTPEGASYVSGVYRYSDMSSTLSLGTSDGKKVYAKYVEVVGAKNAMNVALSGNDLTTMKNDVKNSNVGMLNTVLFEPEGSVANNFEQITFKVDEKYNGYTFTVRYYIQQYDGTIKMVEKEVMFSKPMFDGSTISMTLVPTQASDNKTAQKDTEFGKLTYVAGGANSDTWQKNTKKITAECGSVKIKSVEFYKANGTSLVKTISVNKSSDATIDVSANDLKNIKNMTLVYDAADFEVGKTYTIKIVSKDANNNPVTTTTVNIKMERPTAYDNQLRPNPGFIPDGSGVLKAWAVFEEAGKASYVMTNAFNNPYTAQWAVRLDVDGKTDYTLTSGKYKAYAPNKYTFVASATESNFKIIVPNAAVKFGEEHQYTMLYGPQYFGLSNLWSNIYNGYRFEDNGSVLYNGAHQFGIKLQSPVAYTTKDAKFKADSYDVEYPNKMLSIGNSQIESDDKSTSVKDAIDYLEGSDERVASVKVTLVDEQFKSLFASYGVDNGKIVIKTGENTTTAGAASVEATVNFSLDVTDQFGNTVGIPFKVKVKSNK